MSSFHVADDDHKERSPEIVVALHAASPDDRKDSPARPFRWLRVNSGFLLLIMLTFFFAFLWGVKPGSEDPVQRDLDTEARHLYARASCDHARAVGLAPALRGAPGYWPHLDADKDGIACEPYPRQTSGFHSGAHAVSPGADRGRI